ncbi:MAG: membrane protein insertion efficiency factor YidD [Firmicutes bacterium]|nr:membrane protein insertion efficiency factor YidD [Bacillota bacterium]
MKHLIIFLIRCYQVVPLTSHKMCRFTPTCSQYMIDAINEYGTYKGIKMGIKRLKRCRPKGDYGYDPVKKKEKEK